MLRGRAVDILPRRHTFITTAHAVTRCIRTLPQDLQLVLVERQTKLSGTKLSGTKLSGTKLSGTLPQDSHLEIRLPGSILKTAGCHSEISAYCMPKMDLDSPQTPNFSGLKDFPLGLFKVSGPPRVRLYPLKDELPILPEKGEFRDSGVFFSSVDSTPEPREADANFLDVGSDSTEGSESIGVDEGKEVVCSPDLDFESDKETSSCTLHTFLSPFKGDTLHLDGLSAGPPILDLTRLMMQPVRSSTPAKVQKATVLPGNLLDQVSTVVRTKLEAGEEVSRPTRTSEDSWERPAPGDSDEEVRLEPQDVRLCEGYSLRPTHPTEEDTQWHHRGRKSRNREAKKRKGASASDGNWSKKEKKVRPNYFVAVQIKNPEVHDHIGRVQQHVAAGNPCLSAAFIPVSTLHLTLHVSHLPDDKHIHRAKAAMEECQQKVRALWTDGHPPLLHVLGLGAFNDKVVFAKLEEGQGLEQLKEIADIVNECFLEHGIASTDTRGFTPHLTVMKLSKAPELYYKGIKKIHPSLYEAFSSCDYGWQRVLGLQLCAMSEPKDEHGYYQVEHEVTFDLPEDEPADGGAGYTANFKPKPIAAKPLKTVVKLEKELKWAFHPPQEQT